MRRSGRESRVRSRCSSPASSARIWTRPVAPRRRRDSRLDRATMLDLLLQAATSHTNATAFMHRLWAYLTLGTTGIVTEEATPLIGGLAAHDHRLRFAAVGMWVASGTWVADLGLYYVGRWRG